MDGLRVVSLFDGISCGRAALEQAGHSVSYYAAFEIDKYAAAISRHNYPDVERHGDVMEADFGRFKGIELLIGGSPCQTYSVARSNRATDKGGIGWELFMKYVEALKIIGPKRFLFENVASMHRNVRDCISEELGCEPIMINSALVSAQQRKRLYWTNIAGVTQPEDRGILLKDILETGITPRDKSLCLDACYYKGGNHASPERQSGRRLMVYEPVALADKSLALLASAHKENIKAMLARSKKALLVAHKVEEIPGAERDGVVLRPEASEPARAGIVPAAPVRAGYFGKDRQGSRIYSVRGKTICLCANSGGKFGKTGAYKIDLPDGDYYIRKLTTTEAERCMGLPDGFTAFGIDGKGDRVSISNTQRYKCLGNALVGGFAACSGWQPSWQAATIAHIFGFMNMGGGFHKAGEKQTEVTA